MDENRPMKSRPTQVSTSASGCLATRPAIRPSGISKADSGTVALAGRAPATFEIKSANLPLVALLLKSGRPGALAQELQAFPLRRQARLLRPRPAGDRPRRCRCAEVDFEIKSAGEACCSGHRVHPVAARGGSEEQMDRRRCRPAWRRETSAACCSALVPSPSPAQPALPAAAREPTCSPRAPTRRASAACPGALVIDKPLRSGQQVYARGRDLVVLAMVNPGAEVIADGHIHVYAPLRGKAIAGARGDTEARILTLCLEPELVSIAGVYRTSENPLPALRGKPAQIRLGAATSW
jgi:septum site-determining protein MinC